MTAIAWPQRACPGDVEFATKPALAQAMITGALAAGVPASWVAGDEVYGADSKLRKHLRETGIGYVLAVAKNHQVITGIGARRAIDLAVRLPRVLLAAHVGRRRAPKGERWYDWALVEATAEAAGPDRCQRRGATGC